MAERGEKWDPGSGAGGGRGGIRVVDLREDMVQKAWGRGPGEMGMLEKRVLVSGRAGHQGARPVVRHGVEISGGRGRKEAWGVGGVGGPGSRRRVSQVLDLW